MRNLLIAFLSIALVLFWGCPSTPEQEHCEIPRNNLDSIFSIGDSVLKDYFIVREKQKLYEDSLYGKITFQESALKEKQAREERQRVIYRDTIVYIKEVKKLIKYVNDTIYNQVTLTDTVRDTVYVKVKRDKKRSK